MTNNPTKLVNDIFKQADELYEKLKKFKFSRSFISYYDEFFDYKILASVKKEVAGNESRLTNILLKYDNIALDLVANRLESECKRRRTTPSILTGQLYKIGLFPQFLIILGFFITILMPVKEKYPDTIFWMIIFILLWVSLIIRDFVSHIIFITNTERLVFLIKQTITLKENLKGTLP
jgi:hypothetical protein